MDASILDPVMQTFLSYFVGLAVNFRTEEILKKRKMDISCETEKITGDISEYSIDLNYVSNLMNSFYRNQYDKGVSNQEKKILNLFLDPIFQSSFLNWIYTKSHDDCRREEESLTSSILRVLDNSDVDDIQVEFLKRKFFQKLNALVASNSVLNAIRQNLTLRDIQEKVESIGNKVDRFTGIFTSEQEQIVLNNYFELSLKSWDIVDLSNLPEEDSQLAAQKILLRKLYIPLRIKLLTHFFMSQNQEHFDEIEKRRQQARQLHVRTVVNSPEKDNNYLKLFMHKAMSFYQNIVVLGDPGGGKSTLLRWLATAYCLKYLSKDEFNKLPSAKYFLPEKHYIPVLIRCRDIGDSDLSRSFENWLLQSIKKVKIKSQDADILLSIVKREIDYGNVLLLVDGLDEITNPQVRIMFCEELDRISSVYSDLPIIITSRIVGYREMPYRMRGDFVHGVIDDLNRRDKSQFSDSWINVTNQHLDLREKREKALDLKASFKSSIRVERLTDNPMLLTTMALVKRKVGKLPNRRYALYKDAVSVLLNWNPTRYETLEEEEAIPQLSYVAYEMCFLGIQSIEENHLIELLFNMREEYKNIRAVSKRSPYEFLNLLEARSSIMIKSGSSLEKQDSSKSIWEFKHLTFQEYFAALALVRKHYPRREKDLTLAGSIEKILQENYSQIEFSDKSEIIKQNSKNESWLEVIRLTTLVCPYDDVDYIFETILNFSENSLSNRIKKVAILLAALSLSDEPDISEEMALKVIIKLVDCILIEDELYQNQSDNLELAIKQLSVSHWSPELGALLLAKFKASSKDERQIYGRLLGIYELHRSYQSYWGKKEYEKIKASLTSQNDDEAILGCLVALTKSQINFSLRNKKIAKQILLLLNRSELVKYTAAWTLENILRSEPVSSSPYWLYKHNNLCFAIDLMQDEYLDPDVRAYLICVFSKYSSIISKEIVLDNLKSKDLKVLSAALKAALRLEVYSDTLENYVISIFNQKDEDIDMLLLKLIGQLKLNKLMYKLTESLSEIESKKVFKRFSQTALNLGTENAFAFLSRYMQSENVEVSSDAIRACSQLCVSKSHINQITSLALDDSFYNYQEALKALGNINSDYVFDLLLRQLQETSLQTKAASLLGLAVMCNRFGRSYEYLIPFIKEGIDFNDEVFFPASIRVVQTLKISQLTKDIIESASNNLSNTENLILSIKAIGNISKGEGEQFLISNMSNQDSKVVVSAINAWNSVQKNSYPKIWENLLESRNIQIVRAVINASNKNNALTLTPIIRKYLTNPHHKILKSAIHFAERVRDKKALPYVRDLLTHPMYDIRRSSSYFISLMPTEATEKDIKKIFSSTDPDIRRHAIVIIEHQGVEKYFSYLIKKLDYMNPITTKHIIDMFGRSKLQEVVPCLIDVIENKAPEGICASAIDSLVKIGAKEAMPALESVLESDMDLETKKRAHTAIQLLS